jgi:PIN domain nuclease of toxin-antitoxin system
MAPVVADLPSALLRQGGKILDLNTAISLRAGLLDWNHRDPFDRMLAATALEMGLPILSADIAFDELSARPTWSGRVW